MSYRAMILAAMTPTDALEGKLDEYLKIETGDHWPNAKSRHFAPHRKEKKK